MIEVQRSPEVALQALVKRDGAVEVFDFPLAMGEIY
jgi:hypothetical protein